MIKIYHRSSLAEFPNVYTINNPHPAEINLFKRNPLHFYVTEPIGGINRDTVPLLVLHGHGAIGTNSYLKSLHKSVASKKNFLIFTVDYLGTKMLRSDKHENLYLDDFTLNQINLNYKKYGLPPFPFGKLSQGDFAENLQNYLKSLPPQLNTAQTPLMCMTSAYEGDHFDFGLVQTLDCLWAIQILKDEYPQIAWQYLTAIGLSHGGYLASQCAKFAPNTFSLIVNGYSWVKPWIKWMLKEEYYGVEELNGIFTKIFFENYWSLEKNHQAHLSPDRMLIRTLNDESQLQQWKNQSQNSKTHFVYTHQFSDEMHPLNEKEEFIAKLEALGFSYEYYTSNNNSPLHYPTLDQGDKTSLKGTIYDFVTEYRLQAHPALEDDFKRKSQITYKCQNTSYTIDYTSGLPIVKVL